MTIPRGCSDFSRDDPWAPRPGQGRCLGQPCPPPRPQAPPSRVWAFPGTQPRRRLLLEQADRAPGVPPQSPCWGSLVASLRCGQSATHGCCLHQCSPTASFCVIQGAINRPCLYNPNKLLFNENPFPSIILWVTG